MDFSCFISISKISNTHINRIDVKHPALSTANNLIHRIENGIRQPSVETLFRFSDTMNVPLPVLFPIRMQNNGTGDLAAVYGKLSPANQKIVCETLNTLMKGLLATQS